MKKKSLVFVSLLSLISCSGVSEPDTTDNPSSSTSGVEIQTPVKDAVLPSPTQYEYQKKGLVAFFHFGPMTFLTNQQMQWGQSLRGMSPSEVFTLRKKIDADRYVKTLKDAGFEEIIFTAKHHDGFALWNTKYTDFNATTAGYPGDVLEDLSAACTKYDMDLGVYLSPWDNYNEFYGTQPDKYNQFYNDQLIEILSDEKYGNKGRIKDVWLDGAGTGQPYAMDMWQDTIERYEPGCIITNHDFKNAEGKMIEIKNPSHWVGNEAGIAWDESWSKLKFDADKGRDWNGIADFAKGYSDGNKWSVIETDAHFYQGEFFWRENNQTPISNKDLASIYKYSIGRGANLLLGVSLNKEGTMTKEAYRIIQSFQNDKASTFGTSALAPSAIVASSTFLNSNFYSPKNLLDGNLDTLWTTDEPTNNKGTLRLSFEKETTFDAISMEESIEYGQRIRSFVVKYKDASTGSFKTFYLGSTIGSKKIAIAAPVTTSEIEIDLESVPGTQPILSELKVSKASSNFAYSGAAPSGSFFIDISKDGRGADDGFVFDKNVWATQGGVAFEFGTNMYLHQDAPDQAFELNFTGDNVRLVGTLDPTHGAADVYLDGTKIGEFDQSKTDVRKIGQLIFSKEGIEAKKHNLRVVSKRNANGKAMLGIEGAFVNQ